MTKGPCWPVSFPDPRSSARIGDQSKNMLSASFGTSSSVSVIPGWHCSFGMGGFSVAFVMGRRAGIGHPSFFCDWIPIPDPRMFWREGNRE